MRFPWISRTLATTRRPMASSVHTYTYEYARPAVTVDAGLVTQEETPHVLLIRRLNDPFKGKWAFPGGFVDADENIKTAVARELLEETSIDLLGEHRRCAIVPLQQVRTFGDDITRDPRGWCITVLYGALVDPAVKEHTKAADDAAEAVWFPLKSPPLDAMAFDHAEMVRQLANAMSGENEWAKAQRRIPGGVSDALRRASRVLDPAFTGGAINPDR